MWPWDHLFLSYLPYSLWCHWRAGRAPREAPTLALAVASQLPDLIDKPADWLFGLYTGRAIGHSLLVVVPLSLVVYWVARRYGRPAVGLAFGFGVTSHVAGDVLMQLRSPQEFPVSYLLWPLLSPPEFPVTSLTHHLHRLRWQARTVVESGLGTRELIGVSMYAIYVVGVLWLWYSDGRPGLGIFQRSVSRMLATVSRYGER